MKINKQKNPLPSPHLSLSPSLPPSLSLSLPLPPTLTLSLSLYPLVSLSTHLSFSLSLSSRPPHVDPSLAQPRIELGPPALEVVLLPLRYRTVDAGGNSNLYTSTCLHRKSRSGTHEVYSHRGNNPNNSRSKLKDNSTSKEYTMLKASRWINK